MTDERQIERRSDNRELAARVAKLESKMETTLAEMAACAARREHKQDELLLMVGSGKMAVRILFWLGSAVVFLITVWQWLAQNFSVRP